jgi:branched-chain amino acid transport system ATP-binding protein
MLVIGRGLMSRPKLLMLDEPSLGLAPMLVTKIFEAIARIRQEGITVIVAEQHVNEVLSLCDRGYVIEGGKVTLEGTGEELLNSEIIKQKYLGI